MLVFGFVLPSQAQLMGIDRDAALKPSSLVQNIVFNNAIQSGKVNRSSFKDVRAMETLYENRNNAPIWSKNEKLNKDAYKIVDLFEDSWTHGLNPESYHVKELRELMSADAKSDSAKFDLLMSDAVMRYAHDMSGMRFDASLIGQKEEYWRQPMSMDDIRNKIILNKSPFQALTDLKPKSRLYDLLRAELIRLSEAEDNFDHLLPINFGGMIKPGQGHKNISKLRERLGVTYIEGQGAKTTYDDALAAKVMEFQSEHGLEPDGIIGSQTLSVLNQTHRSRMEQVVANLERLRWLDTDRPDKYILVNIPSQMLWAVEGGKVVHEMKVVVGLPHRKTMSFKAEITGMRLNPTWTVPLKLKMQDFLPKLLNDPEYLTYKGISVRKGVGRDSYSVDPSSVDWESVDWAEMNKMRFVQSPGDHNALGRFRVLMPNRYDIYMHDTNHPEFFEKTQRTYSSGCIRLSEPEKIAHFILGNDDEEWSYDRIYDVVDTGKMTDIETERTMPVYVLYQSVWLDPQGRVVYGSDVYKHDQKLIDVLANLKGYHIPDNSVKYADALNKDPVAIAQ